MYYYHLRVDCACDLILNNNCVLVAYATEAGDHHGLHHHGLFYSTKPFNYQDARRRYRRATGCNSCRDTSKSKCDQCKNSFWIDEVKTMLHLHNLISYIDRKEGSKVVIELRINGRSVRDRTKEAEDVDCSTTD